MQNTISLPFNLVLPTFATNSNCVFYFNLFYILIFLNGTTIYREFIPDKLYYNIH